MIDFYLDEDYELVYTSLGTEINTPTHLQIGWARWDNYSTKRDKSKWNIVSSVIMQ